MPHFSTGDREKQARIRLVHKAPRQRVDIKAKAAVNVSKMADMMFYMKKNKEKEQVKAKERETKEKLKTEFTKDTSGEEKFFKKVNDKEAQSKETARTTVKDNEKINMAKAVFG